MRYFWSLIAVLCVLTAGLFTLRVSRERAAVTPTAGPGAADTFAYAPPAPPAPPATPTSPARATPPVAEPPAPLDPAARTEDPQPEPPAAAPSEPAPEPEPEPELLPDPEPVAEADEPVEPSEPRPEPAPASNFSLDELLGVVAEVAERTRAAEAQAEQAASEPTAPAPDPMMAAAAAAQSATAAPAPRAQAGPSFEVRPDGSIAVDGVGIVPGDGSAQRPFVLDWEVLRSVQRDYNPRQGQAEVPAWLGVLDGKRVRIEGNTLLPVVGQTTDELLVMQNPWDGCCLGVPPTPYDAVEVKLARPQRMGNAPTGFGQVEGVFKVDAYIVSGWLLGLFVIEQATFESGAGIELPEI